MFYCSSDRKQHVAESELKTLHSTAHTLNSTLIKRLTCQLLLHQQKIAASFLENELIADLQPTLKCVLEGKSEKQVISSDRHLTLKFVL